MNRVSVTAVIPVCNGQELLACLLRSIKAQTVEFEEVLVVDNGSTDAAPTLAAQMGCRVIYMGYNSGFARAVNRGWKDASTEWIAVLNSDVELAPDWLEQCLGNAGEASFVTGKLLQFDNPTLLDGTYDLVSRAGCAWRAGNGQQDIADRFTTKVIDIAPATAALYRRELLHELNGLDESFESYLEDVDFGLRCARAGYVGFYVPSARATHRGGATFGGWSPRVVRLISRNQVLLLERHYDRTLLRQWLWPIFVGQMLWGLLALRHGTGLAWSKGKVEGLRSFHPAKQSSAGLQERICQSEAEIRQKSRDWYWVWYFRLTGAC